MAESVETTSTLLTPLRRPDFIRLWMADGLWWQSMWMETLVTGWLALEMTDSAWWVSVVAFCRNIPVPLVGFLGPVWVDRFRRRRVIQALQSVNLLAALTLATLYHFGRLEYWHLTMVSLANGAAWALDWPTRRALLPDLVGRDHVVDAMVLENLIQGITRISGPLSAGYVMAAYGNLGALVVLVILGLLALVALVGMQTDARAPKTSVGVGEMVGQTLQGWAYVRSVAPIFGVLLITIFMNVWAFPYMNLLPVFARDIFAQGPEGLGWLGAASGVGAFFGLALVHLGRRCFSNERLFVAGSLFSALGVVAFAYSDSFALSLFLLFCSGLGQAGFSIMQSSVILVEASDEMRSRAMGALVVAIGMGPLGRLQSGAMAEIWGVQSAVGAMALMAVCGILAAATLLRGFVWRGKSQSVDAKV